MPFISAIYFCHSIYERDPDHVRTSTTTLVKGGLMTDES